MKKFGRFFWQSPKNNDIRLRRASAGRLNSAALIINSLSPKQRRALFYNKFVFAPRKRTLRAKELHEEKTFEQAYAPRGCCLFVKIRDPVASADMRRHSDTLRGAQRRRKRGLTGEKTHEQAFCAARVFAPPSKSRERGDRKGANGGKREGERSERESVVTRLNLSSRQKITK